MLSQLQLQLVTELRDKLRAGGGYFFAHSVGFRTLFAHLPNFSIFFHEIIMGSNLAPKNGLFVLVQCLWGRAKPVGNHSFPDFGPVFLRNLDRQ